MQVVVLPRFTEALTVLFTTEALEIIAKKLGNSMALKFSGTPLILRSSSSGSSSVREHAAMQL